MTNAVYITVDKEKRHFVLTGPIKEIQKNRRLFFSFKRLKSEVSEIEIRFPYEEKRQIKTLQEIQDLLEKFDFSIELSKETAQEVGNFKREQDTFEEFSEKARAIRNDEFKAKPELIDEFEQFCDVLEKELVRKLYPLQLLSAYHLAFAQNACNFAVPGAGKTSVVYGAFAYLRSLPTDDSRHVDKLLVIGPLSSFAPWEKEFEACFGRRVDSQRLSGDEKVSREQKEQHLFSGSPAELTLIYHGGVDALQNEIVAFLKANKTMVVVDEAHRIKNPDGVWGKSIVTVAKHANARVVLTGTPVPNGYEDLYNLYQFLYPFKFKEILGLHYGNLVEMTKRCEPDDDRVKNFTRKISPYFIRIKKADLDLPPTNEASVEVIMDATQREIYDFIETKYINSFEKNPSANIKDYLNKARLIRLRQAATNPALLRKSIEETLDEESLEMAFGLRKSIPEEYQDDSEIMSKICNYEKLEIPRKFEAVKDLLIERIFKIGGKAIIWTIFIQNAKQLQEYLRGAGMNVELLIGEVIQEDREKIIEKFNDPKNSDFNIVIANPFAVAESISLHKGCHNAIYLERDYNCSNFLQSKDRIHRVGLQKEQETNYFYILAKDSIDEVINERLAMKVLRMEKIIDEEIPLFAHLNDADETDLIRALIENYAKRT